LKLGALAIAGLVAFGLAGCIGNTDPASHIRATQANLNAHGRTDNGPAFWWWEYGTSQSEVQNGQGTDTEHFGPAGSPSDVPLSYVARSLTPGTTYYFRACGQDQSSPTPICGSVLNFRTSPADSSVWSGAFGLAFVRFTGATDVAHAQWKTYSANGRVYIEEQQFGFGSPNVGGTIGPGPNCQTADIPGSPYDRAVHCSPNGITFVEATFGDFNDQADSNGLGLPVLFFGGGGNDTMTGSTPSDTLFGGPANDQLAGNGGRDFVTGDAGIDTLHGNDGDDDVDARDGQFFDLVDCGNGTDTAYVDFVQGIPDEYNYALAHGCETVLASGSAARAAQAEREAWLDGMRRR
jgi:Ca2+-binding RTX toxin-like protein